MKKNQKKFALIIGLCMVLAGAFVIVSYQKKVWNVRNLSDVASVLQQDISEEKKTANQKESIMEQMVNGNDPLEKENVIKSDEEAAQNANTEEEARAEVLDRYYNLGVVREDVNYLNIREMPTTDSLIIGKMPKYCGMNVLSKTTDWYYVQSGDIAGYVSRESVVTGKEAEELALKNCKQMLQVIPETLDVYKEPSVNAKVWTKLNQNER